MTALETISRMTSADLAALGTGQIAYLKAVTTDQGDAAIAAYAANGEALFLAPTLELAQAAAKQNGLEPVQVH